MKQAIAGLALLVFFSCTKEHHPQFSPGTWTIVESNIGTGTDFLVQTYRPSTELTVEFGADGHLSVTGSNPGTANSPLWGFDRYEIKPGNVIRFYQAGGNREMDALLTLSDELHLNYLQARCAYEETFSKIN